MMADFRSHEEKRRDEYEQSRNNKQSESEARAALARLEPKIEAYEAEVRQLREDNRMLTEALKTQMQGVEEIKGFLMERMDSLSTDMQQVHRKIRGLAEDDMKLVKQLGDSQNDRLARLADMVKGGK